MARQEPRSRSHLRRRRPIREAYDRVPIVCEGSKTEPAYLSELVDRHKLSTADVVVIGSGSDPRALVKRAKTLRQAERRDDRYDRVYCVFDRDQHAQFDSASDEARRDGMLLARSWALLRILARAALHLSSQPIHSIRRQNPGSELRTGSSAAPPILQEGHGRGIRQIGGSCRDRETARAPSAIGRFGNRTRRSFNRGSLAGDLPSVPQGPVSPTIAAALERHSLTRDTVLIFVGAAPSISPMLCRNRFIRHRRRVLATISLP